MFLYLPYPTNYSKIQAYGFTWSGIFPPLMVHHVNIILCFFNAMIFNLGYYYILLFMTNEISQPFLHGSWFFMKLKWNHWLTKVNQFLLVVTFLGSRAILNTFTGYYLIQTTKTSMLFSSNEFSFLV
jgi:hypothetical protein